MRLKPCPFCGGEVAVALTGSNYFNYWIITRSRNENHCTCGAYMESNRFLAEDSGDKQRDELILKWNTRKPMVKVVEQLEEKFLAEKNFRAKGCWLDAIEIVKGGCDGM